MNGRQEGGDIETMPLCPSGPYALGRRNGIDDRAVHVEQQRAKGTVRKGTLAHDGVGTAKAALKQPSGNERSGTAAHLHHHQPGDDERRGHDAGRRRLLAEDCNADQERSDRADAGSNRIGSAQGNRSHRDRE